MPVDLTTLRTVAPEPLGGLDAVPDGAAIITSAQQQTPEEIAGLTVKRMDPKAEAGVDLVKKVLAITAASILVLLIYLSYVDGLNDVAQRRADETFLAQAAKSALYPDPGRLAKWSSDLKSLVDNVQTEMTAEVRQEGTDLVAELRRNLQLPAGQLQALSACADVRQTGDQRIVPLNNCIAMLVSLEREAANAVAKIDRDRLLMDFSKEVSAHNQAFRTFWMQTSQMILLNLLLPLLTALLGYIFGTQQSSQGKGSD